ncbi:MAG: SSS family solute:Na+ symporter, partial [Paracoccaceae bacterium]
TSHVPAIGAKVAVVFHVIAYGVIKFAIDPNGELIHFIHLYAVLFFIEVAIMLFFGYIQPKQGGTHFSNSAKVDLTPWRYGWAASSTMFAGIIALYLLFSPVGLVGGLSGAFWGYLVIVLAVNVAICIWSVKRFDKTRLSM